MAAPGITVLKNNAPWGPFTREQIGEGLIRGDFTVKSLAHAPGLGEWLPLGEVLDFVDRAAKTRLPTLPPVPLPRELPRVPVPIAPKPEAPARPPNLPTVTSVFQIPGSIPPVTPVVEKKEIKPESKPEPPLIPASFFQRGIAFLIDCAILFVPVAIVYAVGALAIEIPGSVNHIDHESRMQEWQLLERNIEDLALLVAMGFGWLYGAGLECSRWQATVGKRWVGIKITDTRGDRLSFVRASGRYAGKYLSALPCFLGFMAALVNSRNLTLHDWLAGTRAVRD